MVNMEKGIGYRVLGIEEGSEDTLYPIPYTLSVKKVYELLEKVMDPEIPTLSVLDLGMITNVQMSDDGVRVRLLPTFVSCPATSYIRANIKEALMRSGFENPEVEMETELAWSSDRISERGRKLLEAFG